MNPVKPPSYDLSELIKLEGGGSSQMNLEDFIGDVLPTQMLEKMLPYNNIWAQLSPSQAHLTNQGCGKTEAL